MREPTAPAYYDRRAPEYDDWYLGVGLHADRVRPGFDSELETVAATIAGPASRQHAGRRLRDRFPHPPPARYGHRARRERAHAGDRLASAFRTRRFVQGDGLALPFEDDSFDRVLTGHFYGHLDDRQRRAFLAEATTRAPESSSSSTRRARTHPCRRSGRSGSCTTARPGRSTSGTSTPTSCSSEIGGVGDVLLAGDWFVVVRSSLVSARSIAALQRENRRCRRCAEAGFPIVPPPVLAGHDRPARIPLRPGAGHGRGSRRACPGRDGPAVRSAAGSRWTRRRSSPPSTARPSRAATRARRDPAVATALRRRPSRRLCATWADRGAPAARPVASS